MSPAISQDDLHTIQTLTTVALWIIRVAAVPATLVPLIYGVTQPWWRSATGRAWMASSTALALLIDLALLFRGIHGHELTKAYIAVSVYGLICLGAWLSLGALLRTLWRARHGRN